MSTAGGSATTAALLLDMLSQQGHAEHQTLKKDQYVLVAPQRTVK